MKVVFVKNSPKEGMIGDVKEVSDGYARNYLIPQGLALPANESNVAQATSGQKKKEKEAALSLGKVKKLVARLNMAEVRINKKANEQGTIFAAVTEDDICKKLVKQNIKVDAKHLKLIQHIKEIGEHKVGVSLDYGLSAKIKVIVGKE